MATRPLPEAAAGSRFAAYVDELHEFLATNRIPFGSPANLAPVAERLHEPGSFADDLSSLVRSFILRQGGAMPHAQLLEILTVAIAGHEAVDAPQQFSEPIRQLLAFVAGVMRRPWNVPPGERGDTEMFRSPRDPIARDPEPVIQPAAAQRPILPPIVGIVTQPNAPAPAIPTPVHPAPAPPTPIPPPQSTPEPSPPPSAIAAALAESKRMSLRPEPEPRPKVQHEPEPHPKVQPEPVLFLRAADVPRPEPEPDLDPTFDAGLDRPSTVFRSVLIAAALAAALAVFFVYSGRKPADILRIHPRDAFAHLEALLHRPSTPPPSVEQPPAIPSPTVPNPPAANLPPAPQPSTAQPPSTQSRAAASTQPAPHTHFFAGTSPQPGRSASGKPLHHPEPAMTWTYPEANPPNPAPPVNAPPAAAHPAQSAPPQPAASTVNPAYNPGQYAPYKPSDSDKNYAPYNPNEDAGRPAEQTPQAQPPTQPPAQIPTQPQTQTAPQAEIQNPAPAPAPIVGEVARSPAAGDVAGIGLGMTPGGPPHRPLSEPAKEIQPSFYSVSSHVMESNLISSPGPDYPAYARATHVQGQVTMEAVIDKEGAVSSVRTLTGHHLLREAAEDAVRRWRYRPYIVNGQPVEVATIVTVEFHS